MAKAKNEAQDLDTTQDSELSKRLLQVIALKERLAKYVASQEEMQRIFSGRFSDLFVLGLATGPLYFVPIVNLVAPVFSALAFTCLCLDELARIRAGEGVLQPGTDSTQNPL